MVMLSNGAAARFYELVDTGITDFSNRISTSEVSLSPDDINLLIADTENAKRRLAGFLNNLHVAQEFKNVDEKAIDLQDHAEQIKQILVEGGNLNDLLQNLSFLDSNNHPSVDQKVFDKALTPILSSVLKEHYDDNTVLERVLGAFALTSKSQSLKIPEKVLLEILKKERLSTAQIRLITSLDLTQVYNCFNDLLQNTNDDEQNKANSAHFKNLYMIIKNHHKNEPKDVFLKGIIGLYKLEPHKLSSINPYLREFVEHEANC